MRGMRPRVDSVLFTFSRLSFFTVAVRDSEVQFAQLLRPPNRNMRVGTKESRVSWVICSCSYGLKRLIFVH